MNALKGHIQLGEASLDVLAFISGKPLKNCVVPNPSYSSGTNSMRLQLGRGWISSATACDRPSPKGGWAILLERILLTASPGCSLAGERPEETKQLHGKGLPEGREHPAHSHWGLHCFSGRGMHAALF